MNDRHDPQRITWYFAQEKRTLAVVTVSGLLYNAGLLAGPLFEGRLVGTLLDVLNGTQTAEHMALLALAYLATIAAVQGVRCIKRLYVRRFANDINRRMKHMLYADLVHRSKKELDREGSGAVLTKAISDVDACAEGMRKFTTEIFDTGVVLVCYIGLLLWYDVKIALLSLLFPPLAYFAAERMKTIVHRTNAAFRSSAERLNAATLDRAAGALTYRIFGCDAQRNTDYDAHLADYERCAVRANIWVSALPPLYNALSMTGVLFILYLGGARVQSGAWDIAAFTTFIACFAKLSVKSSKAAKLFNAVQQAQVSWRRIKGFLCTPPEERNLPQKAPCSVKATGLSVPDVLENANFEIEPGQIIGITGPVACGKSMLGKAFLCENPYEGSIWFDDRELASLDETERCAYIGYLGHDTELLSDTVENNILLGSTGDVKALLRAVRLEREVTPETRIGAGGMRLSGGQQQRLALARQLANLKPLLILDDPFSALDRRTEREVFDELRKKAKDSAVLLISHRLYVFPELDGVLWMQNGVVRTSTHAELMASCPEYAELYKLQQGGQESA